LFRHSADTAVFQFSVLFRHSADTAVFQFSVLFRRGGYRSIFPFGAAKIGDFNEKSTGVSYLFY
ncbi:MAG TPA: hypothetical protein PL170_11235, partial [Ferruginibacter sp.]|nr:hypothetical protein [Ferruginibacter sp.]